MPGRAGLGADAAAYAVDAMQRWVLLLDTLRQRGNQYIAHEKAGMPPVLHFEHEIVVDGRHLPRPVNYALVRILPPPGVIVDDAARPFVIVDPRAGHGAGIGGFKSDSQVGVAMRAGHPVYFVVFFPQPCPGQTLLDVCTAEGQFLRTVAARHPEAPKPIVIGNCQGGWAVMMLGASQPELTGPIVINGAPLSYWAGRNGKNPMRYLGGLTGGCLPALLLSDMGGGVFDGANLVLNFELLNPANTFWSKYYNLYASIDTEEARFLEFERWWSGFYLMNEEEIRWIVDNLFIGNRLARGKVELDARSNLDLKSIRSPSIVFASAGDNITPPQQALNWIADVYQDTQEIKSRGQVIVYLVHEDIGHLGIFVSAKVAKKEHAEIVTTLQSIESLASGLYEMVITDREGSGETTRYHVAFEERSIADLLSDDDGREDEAGFEEVARVSRLNEQLHDMMVRPIARLTTSPRSAEMSRRLHPLRVQRYAVSNMAPWCWWLPSSAETIRATRQPVAADNPFLAAEKVMSRWIEASLDAYRDVRDASHEIAFHALYGGLALLDLPGRTQAALVPERDASLRDRPEINATLGAIETGGFAEAVIRMLIVVAQSRGSVRRSRLERSNHYLTTQAPFAGLGAEARARIIREQGVIVSFEPEKAIATLPRLLPDVASRRLAMMVVEDIAGPRSEMSRPTLDMMARLYRVLGLPEVAALGGATPMVEVAAE